MKLFPFAHYYALFAGATSALIIIPQINAFIIKKLGEKFKKYTKEIEDQINPLIESVEQNLLVLKVLPKEEKVFKGKVKTTIKIKTRKYIRAKEWFIRKKRKLNVKEEKGKVNNMGYSLCIYSCFYCICMIILIGFTEADSLDINDAFSLLAHFNIVGIPAIVGISIYINRAYWKRFSSFIAASFLFLTSVIICLVLNFSSINLFEYDFICNVFLSFFIAAFPFIAIFFRIFALWPVRFYLIESLYPKKKAIIYSLNIQLGKAMDELHVNKPKKIIHPL